MHLKLNFSLNIFADVSVLKKNKLLHCSIFCCGNLFMFAWITGEGFTLCKGTTEQPGEDSCFQCPSGTYNQDIINTEEMDFDVPVCRPPDCSCDDGNINYTKKTQKLKCIFSFSIWIKLKDYIKSSEPMLVPFQWIVQW